MIVMLILEGFTQAIGQAPVHEMGPPKNIEFYLEVWNLCSGSARAVEATHSRTAGRVTHREHFTLPIYKTVTSRVEFKNCIRAPSINHSTY